MPIAPTPLNEPCLCERRLKKESRMAVSLVLQAFRRKWCHRTDVFFWESTQVASRVWKRTVEKDPFKVEY